MSNSTTIDPLDVIEEAEQLWPHNEILIEDISVEMAVLCALGKPTDAPNGVALLRRAGSHSSAVRRLFNVVFGWAKTWSDFDFFAAPCDRCLRDVQPLHTLWVPAGATVVELHCCDRCRQELDADYSDVVWK